MNVQPLGGQFDAVRKKSVPDVIHRVLCGGDDAAAYAIVDGSRIVNIEECLEASGLKHACLFRGDMSHDMRAVAPWLVQINDDNAFTRSLFTRGKAPWCRWDAESGILIRAVVDFDTVWRHFRRFTRVRDETGHWHYFRFWEPSIWPDYSEAIKGDAERIAHWALYRDMQVVFEIMAIDAAAQSMQRLVVPKLPAPTNTIFTLDSRELRAFVAYRHQRFCKRLCGHLSSQSAEFAALAPDIQLRETKDLGRQAAHYGLRIEKAVADFATAHVLSRGAMMNAGLCRIILESDDHQIDKGRKLLDEVRARIAN